MAASKELITKIVLRGQVDGSLTKALSTVSKQADTSLNKLSQYGQKLSSAFKTAAVVIGSAAVGATKSAIDYESAFAGVQKTIEETDTTKYEDLSAGIRKMAKETPAAATEIANVAASAGQLGIKADDVLSFSKTMIDLGESTNLSSEDAATAIAKLFNVTGTSMSKVGNFGATLVALGNNAATTEADIMNMASRIAGSGKQIGLTEQQTLALATSLSSVGIEAELGGSAISTTMTQIDKAVATNDETLSVWAKTAGMSTAQFAKAWKTDAYGALQKVIKGMGETKDEGGNLNLLLEELGINSIRQGDTLKRLSSASGLMAEMTDLANKSWEENAALTKEASTRYNTMASKLKIAKNRIVDAAITIGNKLLPILDQLLKKFDEIDMEAVADKIAKGIQWIIDNFDLVKAGLIILASAFPPYKIGSFITTVAGATKELKLLCDTLGITAKLAAVKAGGIKAAFAGLGTKLSGAFSGIGSALGAIGPVGWAVIAILAVLGGAFAILWKKSESFRTKITSIIDGIKEKFSAFSDGIAERLSLLGFNFKGFGDTFKKIFSAIGKFLGHIFSSLFIAYFETISDAIGNLLNIITGFVDIIVGIFTGDWQRVWEGVKSIVLNVLDLLLWQFKFIGKFLWNLFGGVLKSIGSWCAKIWNKVVTWVQNLYSNVKNWVVNTFNSVVTFFQQLPSKIWGWLVSTAQKVQAWGVSLWEKAKSIGSNFLNAVVTFFKQLPYKIGYFIGFCIGKIALFGVKLWNFATVTVPQFIGKVIEWFKQLPSKIWNWLKNVVVKIAQWSVQMNTKMRNAAVKAVNAVVNFFKTLPSKVWNWLRNVIVKIGQWGTSIYAKMRSAAVKAINAVVNFFKQLPSKVWTWLSNTIQKVVKWGSDLVAKGRKAASDLLKAIVNGVKKIPEKMKTIGKNVVKGLWNGIKNAKDWLVGKIKSFGKGITDGIADAFGCHSPSKITFGIGGFVGKGLGLGLMKTTKFVGKAANGLRGVALNALSNISPSASGVAGKIKKYGTGGTVTSPQTAIVGDKPETIVPHGNTPRNRSLLAEAARGVGSSIGGATYNFTFAPVINGGNADENKAMIRSEEEEFERRMDAWIAKNRRLAF